MDSFPTLHPSSLALAGTSLVVLWHLVPWLYDTHGTRSIPGPFIAKFSDIWLGLVAKNGHRSEVVHQLHLKYGTFHPQIPINSTHRPSPGPLVRLAPNHLSIADPEALHIVYGHGNGALKSQFYDAFVSIHRGVFNTRDRAEHARKRKIVSHVFSQKSVVEFEPHIHLYISSFIKQWDRLYDGALHGGSGPEGEGWRGEKGYLWLDCLPCTYLSPSHVSYLCLISPGVNYLAFDIVGDLAFGAPFGMISDARDTAQVPKNQADVMRAYGDKDAQVESIEIPAVKILNGRGEYSMAMGVLPGYWRPFARLIPWYRRGSADVKALAGIAIMAVMKRFRTPTDRVDLLNKLQEGRDSNGNPMGREELTAEALTLLIAGSDTTSKSVFSSSSSSFGTHPPRAAPPAPSYTTSHATRTSRASCKRTSMNISVPKISPSQLRIR